MNESSSAKGTCACQMITIVLVLPSSWVLIGDEPEVLALWYTISVISSIHLELLQNPDALSIIIYMRLFYRNLYYTSNQNECPHCKLSIFLAVLLVIGNMEVSKKNMTENSVLNKSKNAPLIYSLFQSSMSVFEPNTVVAILKATVDTGKQKKFERDWKDSVCLISTMQMGTYHE